MNKFDPSANIRLHRSVVKRCQRTMPAYRLQHLSLNITCYTCSLFVWCCTACSSSNTIRVHHFEVIYWGIDQYAIFNWSFSVGTLATITNNINHFQLLAQRWTFMDWPTNVMDENTLVSLRTSCLLSIDCIIVLLLNCKCLDKLRLLL